MKTIGLITTVTDVKWKCDSVLSTEDEGHGVGEVALPVVRAPVLAEATGLEDREGHVAHVMVVALAKVRDALELEAKDGSVVGLHRLGSDHAGLVASGAVVSDDEISAIHVVEIGHLLGIPREHDLSHGRTSGGHGKRGRVMTRPFLVGHLPVAEELAYLAEHGRIVFSGGVRVDCGGGGLASSNDEQTQDESDESRAHGVSFTTNRYVIFQCFARIGVQRR